MDWWVFGSPVLPLAWAAKTLTTSSPVVEAVKFPIAAYDKDKMI